MCWIMVQTHNIIGWTAQLFSRRVCSFKNWCCSYQVSDAKSYVPGYALWAKHLTVWLCPGHHIWVPSLPHCGFVGHDDPVFRIELRIMCRHNVGPAESLNLGLGSPVLAQRIAYIPASPQVPRFFKI